MIEISKIDFSMKVEEKARTKELSLIESCLEVAEELDIDPADIPKLIYPALKDKIEYEGVQAKQIKSSNTSTLEQFF
ncbi:late promoter transcription accessory protein [Aeromonas phage AsFcp_4]|uniref:Gp33 late promoter transcription accessory protein n=1 Tax=Aeromonas phage PX29 TaxID=926067 RepID=E5DQP1_9CAUD|nr:late promoter transcriptional regulator [Aeromonas phage PX29]ADQ53027.1 gp33 late promoter transcription accessory protein [Aeromonas phage PX29]QAX98562.1 late promoter transcription accessory protein [Aeromonas phage AsFcp_2]QAX99593.1 late promoter transcription accessory protein [Aeromonas phage AsFcp_4]